MGKNGGSGPGNGDIVPLLHSGKSRQESAQHGDCGSSIHHDRALTNEEREQSLDSMIRCALELAAEAAEAAEKAWTADRILAPGYTA